MTFHHPSGHELRFLAPSALWWWKDNRGPKMHFLRGAPLASCRLGWSKVIHPTTYSQSFVYLTPFIQNLFIQTIFLSPKYHPASPCFHCPKGIGYAWAAYADAWAAWMLLVLRFDAEFLTSRCLMHFNCRPSINVRGSLWRLIWSNEWCYICSETEKEMHTYKA